MSALDRLVRSRYQPRQGELVVVHTRRGDPLFGRIVKSQEIDDALGRRTGWNVTVDALLEAEQYEGPSRVERIGPMPLFFTLGKRHRAQAAAFKYRWAERLPKGVA